MNTLALATAALALATLAGTALTAFGVSLVVRASR